MGYNQGKTGLEAARRLPRGLFFYLSHRQIGALLFVVVRISVNSKKERGCRIRISPEQALSHFMARADLSRR